MAMMIILYVYAVGVVLVALRLGWHMMFRLDRYDWHYSKTHIWTTFTLSVLLWPLMAIKPRNLIQSDKLFEGSLGVASSMRERDQLWNDPPPCGSVIRYRQGQGRYEETYGEFIFRASEVERSLRNRLRDSPNLANEDEGAILNWLCRRTDTLTQPTDVPSAWWRFQFVANDLIRSGNAKAHCLKCGADVPKNELVTYDDHARPGWNFERLKCPNGHGLLVVEKMHLLVRKK